MVHLFCLFICCFVFCFCLWRLTGFHQVLCWRQIVVVCISVYFSLCSTIFNYFRGAEQFCEIEATWVELVPWFPMSVLSVAQTVGRHQFGSSDTAPYNPSEKYRYVKDSFGFFYFFLLCQIIIKTNFNPYVMSGPCSYLIGPQFWGCTPLFHNRSL